MIIKMNGVNLPDKNIVEQIQETPVVVRLSNGTVNALWGSMLALAVPNAPPLAMPVFSHPAVAAVGAAVNTSGFFKLLDAIIAIMDPVATCVVVFAGLAWMFGHRTKSIDLLIGVAAGTLIITHAHDLVTWLRHVM